MNHDRSVSRPGLKTYLRRALLWSLARLGGLVPRPYGLILAYHSIDAGGSLTSVHPDVFRWQMEYLKRSGRRGVSIGEYLKLRRSDSERRKVAAITFDDGYRNFAGTALPILAELGFTATVFLVAGAMGGRSTWKRHPSIPAQALMSWEEAAACRAAGMEMGSHTRDHLSLTGLPPEKVREQLLGGKAAIEKHLGREARHFCYPYGDYDRSIVRLVRECGYQSAVTCRFANDRPAADLYQLPRLGMNRVRQDDPAAAKLYFQAAVNGLLPVYQRLKRGSDDNTTHG